MKSQLYAPTKNSETKTALSDNKPLLVQWYNLVQKHFSPSGDKERKVGGGVGSVAQGSLPTTGIATVLTKLIRYEDKQ